jgi:hypothetical protein
MNDSSLKSLNHGEQHYRTYLNLCVEGNLGTVARKCNCAWNELPVETLGKIIDDFPVRLNNKCIQAKGGTF